MSENYKINQKILSVKIASAVVFAAIAIPTTSYANGWSISGTATNSSDYVTLNHRSSSNYKLFGLNTGLTFRDTKGDGLDYGSVNLSLSKSIWRNELSTLTGNLSHSMDVFLEGGQLSQTTTAQLNLVRMINSATAIQLSSSHSERDNLQQQRHATTNFTFGISSNFKNISYSTNLSLGKNKQGELSDNFNSIDFSISYPLNSQLNLNANFSDGFDHQRRIFENQAYDIWDETQQTSIGLTYILNRNTSLTFNKRWSKNKTEYVGQYYNAESSDWSVSFIKVF